MGRKNELADVLRALVEGARLVTIAGPTGIGKTRLAAEAEREYGDVYGGVAHVLDDASGAAVTALLERPATQVLAAAGAPLGLDGERVVALRPLALAPAVELFRRSAEAVEPTLDAPWETLAELVRQVGGVPRALERAGAEWAAREPKNVPAPVD